jgi:hypothetical protein
MKECDSSTRKIHTSSNFILSVSLLMFDTLLLIYAYTEILLNGPPCHFVRFLTHSMYYVGPTDWRINELTLQARVLSGKLKFPRLIKKFPLLYRICVFVTISRNTRHYSLSWARLIYSTPLHLACIRSIYDFSCVIWNVQTYSITW